MEKETSITNEENKNCNLKEFCKEHSGAILTGAFGLGAILLKYYLGARSEHTRIHSVVGNTTKHSINRTSGYLKTKWFSNRQYNNYQKFVKDGDDIFDALMKAGIRLK